MKTSAHASYLKYISLSIKKMKFYFGIQNYSSLHVILFLIVSTENMKVKGNVFNLQSPATNYYEIYKISASKNGTSKHQSSADVQQEFYNPERKRVIAAELENRHEVFGSEQQRYIDLPINYQDKLIEKNSNYEREERGFYQELKNSKPAEPLSVGRNLDEKRATSFFHSDFGRPEFFKIDRPSKSEPPQSSPRPRKVTNTDFRQLGSLSKQTDRPQNVLRSQNHFQIPAKPQKVLNPFLNKPVSPQINPNFQSIDQRFTPHNRPHTNLHNSDIVPHITPSTHPSSSYHQHSHQFSTFNTRPENTNEHITSQFTHTDKNVGFSRPNNRPVDFSSFPTIKTRPGKTNQHTVTQFEINSPHSDQNIAFSRPNNIPVEFSSIVDRPVSSSVNLPESHDNGIENRHTRPFTRPFSSFGHGCKTVSGYRRPGEVWYSSGCRRSKCISFRGHSSIETDQCDTEIYNTVYSCIIEVNLKARYPGCCPRYRCNPDNLGNLVDRAFG